MKLILRFKKGFLLSVNFLLLQFIFTNVSAQTFTGLGGPILDADTTNFSQQVSSLPTDKLRPQYGLASVELNLTHTYVQNLVIYVIAPDGTPINLMYNAGGSGDNLTGTVFTDAAVTNIQLATPAAAPFAGNYNPREAIGNINNYHSGEGEWKLVIRDDAAGDIGNLISWKLNFAANVTGVADTFNSNIPVIYLNTFMEVPRVDSVIRGNVKVIDNGGNARNKASDSIFQFLGNVEMKVRGNYSLNFPQRSYNIELFRQNWSDDTSVALCGMPAETDWLLVGTWNDRAFVRNPLMYQLFYQMGHYATRFRFCEVFLNGEYVGIYQLTEKIKRDNDRVDIAKLKDTDLAGDSLTGGYIFKHDYVTDTMGWLSSVAPPLCNFNFGRYQYVYPSYKNIKPQQADYIRTIVDTLEKRLFSFQFADSIYGYRPLIDANSFADYLICNEFSWNGDGFAKSMYFYKDKDSKDPKIYAGPVWDFDWSLKKMPWINDSIDVWSYKANPCNNLQATLPWYSIMMEDPYFRNIVRCRYEYFRTNILSQTHIDNSIDAIESMVDEAQIRHYTKWPTWGLSLGTPEQMPYSINMQQELDTMKAMIARRLQWMDMHLPGICTTPLSIPNVVEQQSVQVYPNPAQTQLNIQSEHPIDQIIIYNALGQCVYRTHTTSRSMQVDVSNFTSGIYILKTQTVKHSYINRIVIE